MSHERPRGRRRAHDEPEAPSTDPASFADLATMWRTVSHTHAVLDHLRRHFTNTATDDRLADQLSLVPVLHDWQPVTEGEAAELVYLLGLYTAPPRDTNRAEVADATIDAIRTMAARRGHVRRSV